MSEFLDGLARAMASPMPRRRALRLLGGALVAGSVPGALRTSAALGGAKIQRTTSTCNPPCGGGGYVSCSCPTGKPDVCFNAGCFQPPNHCCCYTDPKTGKTFGAGICSEEYRCGKLREPACVCKRPCGSWCCKVGEYCASPKHGLCCADNYFGMGKEELCVSAGGAQCCKPGTKCCGEACCHTLTQTCDDEHCACKRGHTRRCGGDCCHPKRHKCCPGSISQKHCAPKNSICCGPKWCPPTKKCCKGSSSSFGSVVGAACVPKSLDCCGAVGYNAATHKCCGQGHTCPKAKICCDPYCCDAEQICTTAGCKAPGGAQASRRLATGRRKARAAGR